MIKAWKDDDASTKIERLGLKGSTKYTEEEKILKQNFDHQDELEFQYHSQKWI